MPHYTYDLLDPTGHILHTVDLQTPVDLRDQITLQRRTIPERLNIPTPEPAASHTALRTAYRAEQRFGNNRDFHQALGFTPAQVKQAWS